MNENITSFIVEELCTLYFFQCLKFLISFLLFDLLSRYIASATCGISVYYLCSCWGKIPTEVIFWVVDF